jgi:DNA-binding transcriptional LysR family regulator
LHVTQPTVTRQLQQLETEFGQPLFERTGGRLVLTRAGEVVYRTVKHLLAEDDRLREELKSLANPEVGTVFIGAGLTPAIHILPEAFALYRSRHPGVTFHLRTGSSREITGLLEQREIDIAIMTTVDEHRTDIVSTPLVRDDLLLVAPPKHPLAGHPALTVSRLADYPMIVMQSGSGLRTLVEQLLSSRSVELVPALEVDNLEAISRLVQFGFGISFLPRSCVRDDIARGRLAVLHLMDEPPTSRLVTMVYRASGSLPANAERFAQELPGLFQVLSP